MANTIIHARPISFNHCIICRAFSAAQCYVVQGAAKPLVYKGSWIERLNNQGVSVAGFDMQGCGFSEGLRGLRSFFESFDDVIADAVQFRRCAIPQVSGGRAHWTGRFSWALIASQTLSIGCSCLPCRMIPDCKVPGFSGLPIFLTGISLGGCVTLNVMQRHVS